MISNKPLLALISLGVCANLAFGQATTFTQSGLTWGATPNVQVTPGSVITWTYNAPHFLIQTADGTSCANVTNGAFYSPVPATSPATYTWTVPSTDIYGTVYYFACCIAGHCAAAMRGSITVLGTNTGAPSVSTPVTMTPSQSPVMSPGTTMTPTMPTMMPTATPTMPPAAAPTPPPTSAAAEKAPVAAFLLVTVGAALALL